MIDPNQHGLLEGAVKLESFETPAAVSSDILYYNDFDKNDYPVEEFIYPNFDCYSLAMEAVNILSMPDETINVTDYTSDSL